MTADEVVEVFAPVAAVRCRAMFGGLGIYAEGVMFGLVASGEIYLKADGETESVFVDAGSTPFTYEGKGAPVRMSYWKLPPSAFEDEGELARYVTLAMAAAHRAAATRQPRRRGPRSGRPV